MTLRRWRLVRLDVRCSLLLAGSLLAIVLGTTIACGTAAVDAPALGLKDPKGPGDPADSDPIDPNDPNDALETAPVTIELAPLTVHTYEGSGQFVHPDAYVFPTAWHGRRFWFAATPYPGGQSAYENPSVFLATGAQAWDAPAGVANPLALPADGGYLSDPELQHDPVRDELRLYFRQTTSDRDQLFVTTSGDGRRWSKARLLLAGARYGLISPAIVREEHGGWRMWTVDPGTAGCRAANDDVSLSERHSADGLSWGAPSLVTLNIPHHVPWHLDVQYVPARHEYWAMVAAYPDGRNCSFTSVFFGRSADGVTWHMSPSPLLTLGTLTPVRNVVYRSTFHYHPNSDAVSVWFSGARLEGSAYVFGGATARYSLTDLLQLVERPFDVSASVHRDRIVSSAPEDSMARAAFVRDFP